MVANSFVETIRRLWLSYPFHVITAAFMLKFLSVLLYASALFLCISLIKKILVKCGVRLSVRANYYSWYTLLLAVPLSYLDFNAIAKFPVYEIYAQHTGEGIWWAATFITTTWILVLLYRIEAFIIQNAKLEGMVRLMKAADVGDAKERAAAAFGLSAKRIRIACAEWVASPLTYGVFRKTILMPRDFREKYSAEELYLLLLHEMGHIKNGDMEKFCFIRFFSCLFMVPPGFLKAFKRDSEILCDNRVLGVAKTSAENYGRLLVEVCSSAAVPMKGLAFSDSYKALQSRVKALATAKPARQHLSVFAAVMTLCFIGAFVIAWNVPAKWYRDSHPGNLNIHAQLVFEDGETVPYSGEENVFYYSKDGYRLYYDYDALSSVYSQQVANGKAPAYLSVQVGRYAEGQAESASTLTQIVFPLPGEARDNPGARMVFPADSEQEYITRYIAHWL